MILPRSGEFKPYSAQGGPPLLNDDPDTPGNRHWEINLGLTLERSETETNLETPMDARIGIS